MRMFLASLVLLLGLTGVHGSPFPWSGTPQGQVLPPTGWQTPYNPDPFTTKICGVDPGPTTSCTPSLTLDSNSASEISYVMGLVGQFTLGEIVARQPGTTGAGDAHFPVYYASVKDPQYTVTCDGTVGECTQFPLTLRIPNGARASNHVDGHLVLIEPYNHYQEFIFEKFNDGGTCTDSTTPVYNGGTISACGGGYATSLTMYANNGTCANCAGIAPRYPIQPTLMDGQEIVNGSIKHALSLAIHCPSSSFYWPATHSDGTCPSGPGEGEFIWLNLTDAQIAGLGYCSWETTILTAMHHYGLLISDAGGSPGPWDYYGYDDWTQMLWGGSGNWTAFFNWLSTSCPSANPGFSSNVSHLLLQTTGLSASNLVIYHY